MREKDNEWKKRQTDRQRGNGEKQTDIETEKKYTDIQTLKPTNRQTGRGIQTDRKRGRVKKTNRQDEKETKIERERKEGMTT